MRFENDGAMVGCSSGLIEEDVWSKWRGIFNIRETGRGDRDYLPPTSWKVWIIDEGIV